MSSRGRRARNMPAEGTLLPIILSSPLQRTLETKTTKYDIGHGTAILQFSSNILWWQLVCVKIRWMERNGARANDTCYQPVPHAWAGMQLAKVLLTLTPKPVDPSNPGGGGTVNTVRLEAITTWHLFSPPAVLPAAVPNPGSLIAVYRVDVLHSMGSKGILRTDFLVKLLLEILCYP